MGVTNPNLDLNKHQGFWAIRSWPSTECGKKTGWANCLWTKCTEYSDLKHPSAGNLVHQPCMKKHNVVLMLAK